MSKKVKLRIEIKSKVRMTPQLFFKHMPYMFKNFNMVYDKKNPDVVIHAGRFPKGNYTRVWYTHENHRPPMNDCDFALSFDYDEEKKNPRHNRMPNYVRLGAGKNLLHRKVNVGQIIKQKTRFCAFVYAHNVPFRNKFFVELSKYKQVDAPGRCCQNMCTIGNYKNPMASRVSPTFNAEKVKFLRPYKFTITFEHSSYPGYCTEKIYHPFLVDSIPIYWGNPLVHRDFNKHKFVNAHETKGLSGKAVINYLVEKVIAIDKNPDLYAKMLAMPAYPKDKLTPYVNPTRIVKFFRGIFNARS